MGKIISFFNHKGGVGKTTLVHNLAFALADRWKRVLLIDADPQMNLTAAMYGLSTSLEYSTDSTSKWMKNVEQYISFSEYLKIHLRNEACAKRNFSSTVVRWSGTVDLISGDINLTNMEADLYDIITHKNEFTRDIPGKFERSLRSNADAYDYILIDTSPSASSIINALLVMSSDYFIAPVSPSFFSLQAIDNLSTIFKNWMKLLDDFQTTQGFPYGMSFRVKFLWIIVQLAKRFNGGWARNMDGFSKATEDWIDNVNTSVRKFQIYTLDRDKSISTGEFISIFGDTWTPFIIEKCCDFTQKLRDIAEKEGIPVVYINQEICRKHDSSVDVTSEDGQYTKTMHSVADSYERIADGLLRLL